VEVLDYQAIQRLPGFHKRFQWFLKHRKDLSQYISYCSSDETDKSCNQRLLAIPSLDRLKRVLRYLFDENEFLSPFGIRSLSKYHAEHPYQFHVNGSEYCIGYEPGESNSGLFGGNSNWRGPVWFPLNYLIIEALERYHYFYGDRLRVEFPTGSNRLMNLKQTANEINNRLARLFLPTHKAPGRPTRRSAVSRKILTGASTSCFTNSLTPKPVPVLERATRQAGPPWSSAALKTGIKPGDNVFPATAKTRPYPAEPPISQRVHVS